MSVNTGLRRLTEKAFIRYCEADKHLCGLCKKYGIKINSALFSELGIVPNENGYTRSQRGLLYFKLNSADIEREGRGETTRRRKAEYIINFIDVLRPIIDRPGIVSFLRATLSNKFNNEIREERKKMGIPIDGFASEEELKKWGTTKGLPVQNSAEIELCLPSTIEAHPVARQLFEKMADSSERYEIDDYHVLYAYFLYDFNRLLNLRGWLIVSTMDAAATITTRKQHYKFLRGDWLDSPEAAAAKKIPIWELPGEYADGSNYVSRDDWVKMTITPNVFYIHIALPRRGVVKQDLTEFFNSSHGARVFKEYRDFYKIDKTHGPLVFGKHWLIYYMSEILRMTRKEINTLVTPMTAKALGKVKKQIREELVAIEMPREN